VSLPDFGFLVARVVKQNQILLVKTMRLMSVVETLEAAYKAVVAKETGPNRARGCVQDVLIVFVSVSNCHGTFGVGAARRPWFKPGALCLVALTCADREIDHIECKRPRPNPNSPSGRRESTDALVDRCAHLQVVVCCYKPNMQT
jgi:hypothetical protein